MPLTELTIKPGVVTDTTDRGVGNIGYWKSAEHVRFVTGQPRKMLGWNKDNAGAPAIQGLARGQMDWRDLSAGRWIAVGTEHRLYVWSGGSFFDVTPARETGSLTNPFTTTISSTLVVVDDNTHGLAEGDKVIYSGASAVGGITINGEYTVTTVVNNNQYKITHSVAASSSAGPGGGTVGYVYLISAGLLDSILSLGYGVSTYNSGTYGTPRTLSTLLQSCRVWTLDAWGEDLIANYKGGGIYLWDASVGTGTRAAVIAGAPATANAILVSTEDRHLIALGAHDGSASDSMLIRWCSQEDYSDWTPTETNTAGEKRLDQGNEILRGIKGRGEHLIFTDQAIYSMTFLGPPDTYGFRPLGANGGLRGPNAATFYNGVCYWMGFRDFYTYGGTIQTLPCVVRERVFADINDVQRFKVWAAVNREHHEIWWLYCSANSTEVDRYVLYNMEEGLWSFGSLARTTYTGDSDIFDYAFAMGTDGMLYIHDSGVNDGANALTASLESGDIEIAPGEKMMAIDRVVPDFKNLAGTVKITLTGKRHPQASTTVTSGPHTVTPTTEFISARLRCRQVSLKVESDDPDDYWQLGTIRLRVREHGAR